MHRSFSYTLLITTILLSISCKTQFVQTSYQTKNISISNEISNDKSVSEIISPFKKELEKDMNRVISFSEVDLKKGKPESLLTNFMADILLEKGTEIGEKQTQKIIPDISYVNYGGIRAPLPKGEITVGNVYELMPFENELVFLQLTGEQVNTFLNVLAKKGGDSVAGVRFKIKNEKASEIQIKSKKLDAEKMYWLATNDYVANGGDDFSVFTKRKKYISTGILIRNLIISYLEEKQKQNENIVVELDERITDE